MTDYTGHTPFPWELAYGSINDSDKGFAIRGTLDGHRHIVAECWPCITDIEARRQMLADGRLILAIPDLLAERDRLREEKAELLAMCKTLLLMTEKSLRWDDMISDEPEMLDAARALIAKHAQASH